MNAAHIPVGYGFAGFIERQNLSYDKRKFPGQLVSVVALVPSLGCSDGETEKLLMHLFASLRYENPNQLGDADRSLWVAGVRPKRSKYVRLWDWATRCSMASADRISSELTPRTRTLDTRLDTAPTVHQSSPKSTQVNADLPQPPAPQPALDVTP